MEILNPKNCKILYRARDQGSEDRLKSFISSLPVRVYLADYPELVGLEVIANNGRVSIRPNVSGVRIERVESRDEKVRIAPVDEGDLK